MPPWWRLAFFIGATQRELDPLFVAHSEYRDGVTGVDVG